MVEQSLDSLRLSEDEESQESKTSSSSSSVAPTTEAVAENNDGSNDVDDGDELDKFSKEMPADDVSPEDRREWMGKLLKSMQLSSLLIATGGKISFSDEAATALKTELEESLEDVMEMLAYSDANPPDQKILKMAQSSQSVKLRKIEKLRVVSWDLGMLSYKYMGTRAKAIVDFILKENLDIVFLQEVNPFVWKYLVSRLYDKYDFSRGRKPEGRFMDFTVTLVRFDTGIALNNKIIYFTNTSERRTVLKTEVVIGNVKLCLLNTHLESMLGNSKFRMMQLQKIFDICGSLPSDFNVIFCGSLNVREWEVAKMKVPKSLIDVWEHFGNKTNQFSWDLRINKLIQMPGTPNEKGGPPTQPQKRWGRIYFRKSQQNVIQPTSFNLAGKEIVAANTYYASDHWALVSHFSLPKDCYAIRENNSNEHSDSKSIRTADLLEGEDGKKEELAQEEIKDNWDDSD